MFFFFIYYEVLGPHKVTSILAQALNWNMDFSAILAPPSLFETRVFVDGHDAWVLGKECVDYLERGPRRRRSAVRVFLGSTVAPRSSNWRLQTTESLGSFTSAHVGLLFIKQHCHHAIF